MMRALCHQALGSLFLKMLCSSSRLGKVSFAQAKTAKLSLGR
jgi:hypothetical protein